MSNVTNEKLSEHDKKVLDSIFNPFQIGGDGLADVDPEAEYKMEQDDQLEAERQKNRNPESVRLELEAIQATEEKDYDKALQLFEQSLLICPKEPALWNNRAQTYRLCGNDNAAMDDLNKSLELSNFSGQSGRNALCQRGLLKRKQKDDDGAREDYNLAAKLGSQFARQQLIEMNPYAALCNQMLKQAFENLS